jgi:copper chaperone NosL
MKMISLILIAILFLSCSNDPQPLQYGKDACYTCKMTLMDKKFGAEIVTQKGKVYKFDDLNCMVNFYNSGYEPEENIAHLLVVDFAQPEKLIDTKHTFFVKSDKLRTPMASQVAAFEREQDYKKFKKDWNGILLGWGEVVTQFK